MTFHSRRLVILALLAVSIGLLIPGLVMPVLTIRGVLQPAGVARMVPALLEKGLDDDTVKLLKSMMSPGVVSLLEMSGGDLRQAILAKLTPQVQASMMKSTESTEIYLQTRSIAGSVKHLYEVGSPLPATLILLFSVIIPFSKGGLVLLSLFLPENARRRTLALVELVAKWSMADVFVVAIFIAYLAAQASQTRAGDPNAGSAAAVAFSATFGMGFYWFTSYCLFSLASQQFAHRWFAGAGREKN